MRPCRVGGWRCRGLVLGVVVLPLGHAATLIPFVLGMVAVGMSTGMYDILGNAHISRLEGGGTRLSLMNLNHAIYSFAYAGGRDGDRACARGRGLARGLVRRGGRGDPDRQGVFTWTRPAATDPQDEAPQESRGRITPYVWLAGLVCLIGFFAEKRDRGDGRRCIFERTLGGGAAEGALGPAMLGLTMGHSVGWAGHL